jgi:periplasmic protein TonB
VPAYTQRNGLVRPRERVYALAAVALIQAALAFALLTGLHVDVTHPGDVVQHLIDITLPEPPPPPVQPPHKPQHPQTSAPKAAPAKLGGSPGPKPAHAPPSVTPIVAVKPTVAASGGGTGSGPALGSGSGGGTGGNGYGDDGDGSDSELIAGEFLDSDYPPALGRAGIGGRVTVTFTVQVNGRATDCRVSRSSHVPELDSLTCRIVEQRYRFRPATDRLGRAVADEADLDHDWVPPR